MLSIRFSVHAFFILIHMYLLDFQVFYWLLVSRLSLPVNACTRKPESHHLIMYTCVCLCMPLGFILRARWVAFWLPWTFMSRFRILDRVGFPVADQSSAVEARIIGRPSGALFLPGSLLSSRVFCDSWVSFVLFILVYLFVFSHLRLSMI